MSLKGSREFKARLRAISAVPKPIGKAWGKDAVAELRARTKRRTGKTARSYRIGENTERQTTIEGSIVADFLDAGTKAHDETAKNAKTLRFNSGGQTFFRKKVHKPRTAGHHFKRAAALRALEKNRPSKQVIDAWNEAA